MSNRGKGPDDLRIGGATDLKRGRDAIRLKRAERAASKREPAAPLAPFLRGDKSGLPMRPPGKS
jgi:hypothetical protein